MRIGKAFSVFGLADNFRQEVATLVKDEAQLAKVELSEKLGVLKRNAVALGIGVFVSFAGLLLVSLSLGRLLALWFTDMGWSEELALFAGISIAGVVVATIGLVFLLKGIKTISKSSLKPERTIETLKEFRKANPTTEAAPKPPEPPPAPAPSKEELEARIHYTQVQLKETARQARKRLAVSALAGFATRHVRRHPMRMLVLGASAGVARRLLRRRRERRELHGHHP